MNSTAGLPRQPRRGRLGLRTLCRNGRASVSSAQPDRIITFLGNYGQIRSCHFDFDLAVGTAGGGASYLSECVLIARVADQLRVRALDRLAREAVEDFATRSVGIFRKNVAVAEFRKMQSLQPAVDGHRGTLHRHPVHHDAVGEQNFECVAIAGNATRFTAVADTEYDVSQ